MALRARGSSLVLLSLTEGTSGEAATGDFRQLPCFSYDLSATQELSQDNVLSTLGSRRDVADPSLGAVNVTGNAVVPVDLSSFGYWLYMLMGSPTTAGTTNLTHTFKSGAPVLPSATQEKGLTDADLFFLYTYVKADTLAIDLSPSANGAKATIGLMGQDEVRGDSSGGGTPWALTFERFNQFQGSITKGGSELANVVAASFTFRNGLEQVRDIRASLSNNGVDEGLATASGSLTLRFTDDSLIDQAIAGTPAALAMGYTISSTKSLMFNFPRAFFGRPSVPVTGPGGIEMVVPFEAAHDTATACLMSVVLKNQVEGYA